ncbi:MBL fold metallo-hydrolase [Formosa sediminum]|uniref:MBL fold metallo-hydrolase n=1 Tax=Formosa sediminum TaxID=2594004 RepID=A0A516GNP5_9FLAO|nr:MBL fold metallo-hydrolase [Formosa sediminum]QDO93148.1 MBL fold metallo-hydrolase [Formosa sediminum]
MNPKNKNTQGNFIFKAALLLVFACGFVKISSAQELKMKYLGGAGWEMTEGDLTILVDPYLSRLKLGDSPANSKDDTRKSFYPKDVYVPDTVTIDKVLDKKIDFILVHHSHLDHLADVPYIAKKTGATVIATETSCKILKAYGIPEKQLLRVRGGEDYQFDKFSVRVIPSIHSALNDKHYYDSRMHDEDIDLPLKLEDFIEGKSLMFLVRFNNHKVLTAGSMNFLEREVDGLKPDIILPGVNFSRLEIYKYTERLMALTNYPKIVIPTHWDNFRVPYGFSQDEAINKKVKPFIEEVKIASPNSKVIVPVHLETITIK